MYVGVEGARATGARNRAGADRHRAVRGTWSDAGYGAGPSEASAGVRVCGQERSSMPK
jgi:hypothetical protein